MKLCIHLLCLTLSAWLVGCTPASQPANLTVYIYEDTDGPVRVEPVAVKEQAPIMVSSLEGCTKFVLPDMPPVPPLPTITSELARTPEAMEGLLLDHIAKVRKQIYENKRALVTAYREHERSCKK